MNHRPTRPSAARRLAAGAVLGLLIAGVATTGASAAPATARAVAPTDTTAPVMIVLDASGSMKADDAPGNRMDAAKNAVTSLIRTLPATSTVGLMVYGTGTGSTGAEKAAGCRDITTLTPVGPLDAATMTAQVATVQASGYTPIGESLRAAAAALPVEGPRSIVLVSDGEDTCAPPTPCDVAAELDAQGVDLTVHTVGFKVDEAARQELSCIAGATGGTFADAADAVQLEQALRVRVDDALSGYTTQGTPVTGDDQPTIDAPLLTPGQYVDRFALGQVEAGDAGPGRNGTTKFYTVPVRPGYRPYVSATLVAPVDERFTQQAVQALGVDLTLMTGDGRECADQREVEVGGVGRILPATAVLNGPTVGGPGYPERCVVDGVQILRVERFGEAYTDRELELEIVVRSEPPADASDVPAAAADREGPLPITNHRAASPVTGGRSFNDAPDLTPGATYSDTLTTGESRYYRFPVQWGQRFSYTLTPASTADVDSNGIAWVDLFNPVREAVEVEGSTSGTTWFQKLPGKPLTASSRYPARFTNRDSSGADAFALDGFYYLRVDANVQEGRGTVPFLITVETVGDVEPGPVYEPTGDSATPGDAATGTATTGATTTTGTTPTPGTTPSSGTTPGAGSAPASVSGGDTRGTDSAASSGSTSAVALTMTGAATDSSGPGAALWIPLGVAVVAFVAGGIWWARRHRATPPPSHW